MEKQQKKRKPNSQPTNAAKKSESAKQNQVKIRELLSKLVSRLTETERICAEYKASSKHLSEDQAHLAEDQAHLVTEQARLEGEMTSTNAALRDEITKVEEQLGEERAARLLAEARLEKLSEELKELHSKLDKLSESKAVEPEEPSRRARPSSFDVAPAEAPKSPDVAPAKDKRKAALADWGFIKKDKAKKEHKTPRPTSTPPPRPASTPPPRPASTPPPRPASTPPPRPPKSAPSAPVIPVDPALEGLSVLDVLESDPTLNQGQRDTLRMVYVRFVPKGAPNAKAQVPDGISIGDVLDSDPNLQRGQREALRTMYNSYGVHRRKRSS